MLKKQLNTERLFQSGEFIRVRPKLLWRKDRVKIFPDQIWFCKRDLVAVLCCPQSQKGMDYGVNEAGLKLVIELEKKKERVNQAYVAFVTGSDDSNNNLELDGYITAQQQLRKLLGVKPLNGKYGKYYWVGDEGDPREDHERDMSDYHDDEDDDEDEAFFGR